MTCGSIGTLPPGAKAIRIRASQCRPASLIIQVYDLSNTLMHMLQAKRETCQAILANAVAERIIVRLERRMRMFVS